MTPIELGERVRVAARRRGRTLRPVPVLPLETMLELSRRTYKEALRLTRGRCPIAAFIRRALIDGADGRGGA